MSDSERGFTLVELLVALVLFAFLTAMLAGGLDLATRRYQGQYSRLERSQRVALVESFLRAQLSGARAMPDRAESNRAEPDRAEPDRAEPDRAEPDRVEPDRIGTRGAIAFDGAPERVRFVAAGPESVHVGGLADLTVAFEPGAAGKNGELVVHWRSFGAANGTSPRDSVLLDRVRRADFAYFGKTAPNAPPGWQPRWQATAGLPSLVRLSLTFDDGTTMPELVVAVETATAPAG